MFNPIFFYEQGKARKGIIKIPFADTLTIVQRISTRTGNLVFKWGDGTENAVTPVKNNDYIVNQGTNTVSKTYASIYTGDVEVIANNGVNDIYSLYVAYPGNISSSNQTKTNIQDFGAWIKQFPNLYSYKININANNNDNYRPIIKGNLIDVPDSVERIYLEDVDVLNLLLNTFVNLNELSPNSKLNFFYKTTGGGLVNMRLFGDLSKLPISCSTFYFGSAASGSYITYTAGKVWASSFDTLSIPLPLSHIENNSLLADMDGSISTSTGGKVIENPGYRTAASDAYVSSLNAKGFTVNIQKYSITPQKILDLDFQNNFTDTSSSALTMIAGGTSNTPTFALSGRKAGEYCAVFNGSQSLKTTTNLAVNSDKVTIAFWMKTTQTAVSLVVELSANTNSNNAFSAYLNDKVANSIQFNSRNSGDNQSVRTGANNGTWKHFVAVIDRAQNGANEILIYENGVLTTFTKPASTDNSGNFVNNILYIGQRGGSTAGFNGSLTRLKIYNYPFTAGEVTNLYNSEV